MPLRRSNAPIAFSYASYSDRARTDTRTGEYPLIIDHHLGGSPKMTLRPRSLTLACSLAKRFGRYLPNVIRCPDMLVLASGFDGLTEMLVARTNRRSSRCQ